MTNNLHHSNFRKRRVESIFSKINKCLANNDFETAAEWFSTLKDSQKDNIVISEELVKTYKELIDEKIRNLLAEDKYDQANDCFSINERLIDLKEYEKLVGEANLNKYIDLFKKGKFDEAESLFRKLKDVDESAYQKEKDSIIELNKQQINRNSKKQETTTDTQDNSKNHKKIRQSSNEDLCQILNRHQIEELYHMTHINNVPSILEKGLYSRMQAEKIGIDFFSVGDKSIIENRKSYKVSLANRRIHNYALLYFAKRTAMQWVITKKQFGRKMDQDDLIFVAFDALKIFQIDGVEFSDGNIASSATELYNSAEYLDRLDWQSIRPKSKYDADKRMKMAEVIVRNFIPAEYISRIVLYNDGARNRLEEALSAGAYNKYINKLVQIDIDKSFYF